MSLTTTILMLIFGWLSVATAMLWGASDHSAPSSRATCAIGKTTKSARRHATAH